VKVLSPACPLLKLTKKLLLEKHTSLVYLLPTEFASLRGSFFFSFEQFAMFLSKAQKKELPTKAAPFSGKPSNYFAVFTPYLLLKRSTRPVESTSFCVPVKNG
jgi:hypothetical protein